MNQEDIYRDIVIEVFAKAERKYALKKKYKLAEFIAVEVLELTKISVNSRTFVNYYERYIEKKEGIAIPKHENIECLCKFLECNSYKDYVEKKYSTNEEQPDKQSNPEEEKLLKNEQLKKTENSTILRVLWIIAILGLGWMSYTLFKPEDKNNCMIWIEDHYEPTECNGQSGEIALDKETQEGMHQLFGICNTSTFFLPNDEPVVWYDKHHKKLTFFTMPGIHPENGKTLKPITQGIIDKYVEKCE